MLSLPVCMIGDEPPHSVVAGGPTVVNTVRQAPASHNVGMPNINLSCPIS